VNLREATKQQILNKSKASEEGRKRFKRRFKSSVYRSTNEMNKIDMNNLFKEGILTVAVKVRGETDDYYVKVSFGKFLDELHRRMEQNGNFDIRTVTQTLISCINGDDVYFHCSCPDYKYRFNFWDTKNKMVTKGDEQYNNGKWIRNPSDNLGSGCKHILLVLSNLGWLQTVARVIVNYVIYMEQHFENMYGKIIYPAIYQAPYDKDAQTNVLDSDTLDSDNLGSINAQRRASTQFKQGNQQGYKFVSDHENQLELDLDNDEENEEQ